MKQQKHSTIGMKTTHRLSKPCAECHSSSGFQDYVGADGSAAGVVDIPPAVGEVITCVACHNEATEDDGFGRIPPTCRQMKPVKWFR